jgi:hypothetical protein
MDAFAGAWVFARADGVGGGGGLMEGLCPSQPPRQRPGGLWKPGFWGGRELLQMRSLSEEYRRCTVVPHNDSNMLLSHDTKQQL